ncbi:hypothetical protein PM3016_6189 [Paenibacillus mucilaginosus 3016]|uniref:DUF1963 domain-containing protein n=1 Tax=Paenibacillus mucilaginosus 3016 TaxID=1116391 RepID=H6NRU4_9BACL|nr:YwqG family protein [Paenibacillus mucilaginosus]AFC32830.1 hypothetical protein PM3016_6189 [Paenibacillus mucilaginosus 3016]WFA21290.1 DUF1963 domain-containing protein [Paenibacillus mucilaginosus]
MNKETILQALDAAGLGPYRDAISRLIYPSHRLLLHGTVENSMPPGASKIGGCPDLPPDLEWPTWRGYPQSFIAQLNLADLPPISPLPAAGVLYFFYAAQAMYGVRGFYEDPRTCSVFYLGADRIPSLQRRPHPETLDAGSTLYASRIEARPTLCVPSADSAYLESLGLGWDSNSEDYDTYWEIFLPQLEDRPSGIIHRLLGHPDQIQADMQMECEMLRRGWTWEDIGRPDQRQNLLPSAADWRLLLQIDSDERMTGMTWGDAGKIYFWIREEDLASLHFDGVTCIMQCT